MHRINPTAYSGQDQDPSNETIVGLEQELFVVFVSQHGGFWMAGVACSALSAGWPIPPIVCFSSMQQGFVTMESFCPNDWALLWGQGPCCVVQPGTEPPMLSMQPSCG